MKSKVNPKFIPSEILSEMESLEIHGGTSQEDVTIHAVTECNTNTYCEGAHCGNCVAQCGGTVTPPPPSTKPDET